MHVLCSFSAVHKVKLITVVLYVHVHIYIIALRNAVRSIMYEHGFC